MRIRTWTVERDFCLTFVCQAALADHEEQPDCLGDNKNALAHSYGSERETISKSDFHIRVLFQNVLFPFNFSLHEQQ